jgi:hypothetical protein
MPGEKVKVCLRVTDDVTNHPVESIVGLAVSDHSLLETIEHRRQPPRLPAMVWLEDEIKELFDGQAYFQPTPSPSSVAANKDSVSTAASSSLSSSISGTQAIDLLLATQGWRRFVYTDIATFRRDHGDAAERVIAASHDQYAWEVESGHAKIYNLGVGGKRGAIGRDDGRQINDEDVAFGGAVPLAFRAVPVMAAMPRMANQDFHVPPAVAPQRQEMMEMMDNAVDAEDATPPSPAPPNEKIAMIRLMPGAHDRMSKRGRPVRRSSPIAVREYAHQLRPGRLPNVRDDFTDTVYWHSGLRTNRDGIAEVLHSFVLINCRLIWLRLTQLC